jgi:putative endonuclease
MLYRIAMALRWRLRRDLGRRGEDLAHGYLRRRKYVIVARNYRPSTGAPGEIDIIAREGDKLVFVEVKTRTNDAVAFPERAVDEDKRRYLIRTARDYARRANVDWNDVRFDVISISGIKRPSIQHMKDAFGVDLSFA